MSNTKQLHDAYIRENFGQKTAYRPASSGNSDLLTAPAPETQPGDLVNRVRQALANARANGYDMTGLTTREVTVDLLKYDAGIEGENFSNVYASVHVVRMNG